MFVFCQIVFGAFLLSLCFCFDSSPKAIISEKEGHGPGGFWKEKVEWKFYWTKQWEEKKIWVPIWRKVWAPREVKQWIPYPDEPKYLWQSKHY